MLKELKLSKVGIKLLQLIKKLGIKINTFSLFFCCTWGRSEVLVEVLY